jgi:hypothetical protein
MEILSEIIEASNEMIISLTESGFFEENLFVEHRPLKRALQIAMQRKWEQENEMLLSEDEFISVLKEVHEKAVAETISDLVGDGVVKMSVDKDGQIVYSSNI